MDQPLSWTAWRWALPLSFAIPFPAQTAGLAIPVIEITREAYPNQGEIANEIDRRYANLFASDGEAHARTAAARFARVSLKDLTLPRVALRRDAHHRGIGQAKHHIARATGTNTSQRRPDASCGRPGRMLSSRGAAPPVSRQRRARPHLEVIYPLAMMSKFRGWQSSSNAMSDTTDCRQSSLSINAKIS